MKKWLSVFLALAMTMGIGLCCAVGANAEEWPPYNATEMFADVSCSANVTVSQVYFMFKPAATGKYTFSFSASAYDTFKPIMTTNVTLYDADNNKISSARSIDQGTVSAVKLESNLKADTVYYYSVTTNEKMRSYTCSVTRTGDADWWFQLPGFLQWILRYICFGFLWMR